MKKPRFTRCKRRHPMVGANVRVEIRYYTPRLPVGKATAKRVEREVRVCVKCINDRAAARKTGMPLPDLRRGSR